MKNTKFIAIAFAFVFTLGAHSAFAFTRTNVIPEFQAQIDEYFATCTTYCDNSSPYFIASQMIDYGNVLVQGVDFLNKGTTGVNIRGTGWGFRNSGTEDIFISKIEMPLLTNTPNTTLEVQIYLGDTATGTPSATAIVPAGLVYTANDIQIRNLLFATSSIQSAYLSTPLVVHAGQMVWFRTDVNFTPANPVKFYGLAVIPVRVNYGGNGTQTQSSFSPASSWNWTGLIDYDDYGANVHNINSPFDPNLNSPYGLQYSDPIARMTMQMTVSDTLNTACDPSVQSCIPTGGTGTSTGFLPPVASNYFPSFVASTATGLDGIAENIGNFFRMIGSWISGSIRFVFDYVIYIFKWLFVMQKSFSDIWATPSLFDKVPFSYLSEIRSTVASSTEAVAIDSSLVMTIPAITSAPLTIFQSNYFADVPPDVMAKIRLLFTSMLYFATMMTLYKIAKQI